MKKTPRVVLDTNLFIAARFNPRSKSAKVIERCLEGEFRIVSSPRLRKEIEMILRNVKASDEFYMRARKLLKSADVVRPTKRIRLIKEDPEDNKLLECVLKGQADYLVTSDRHLLKLRKFAGTKICKPERFLELFALKSQSVINSSPRVKLR